MTGRVVSKVVWAAAAYVLLILSPPAWAASIPDAGDLLIGDIGPGWSAVTCPENNEDTAPQVCFRTNQGGSRDYDYLTIEAQSLTPGVDPRAIVSAGALGEPFDTPGLEVAHGDVVQIGARAAVSITMFAGDYVFILILDSNGSLRDAESLLLDVARRQQAAARSGATASPKGPATGPSIGPSTGATMDAATRRRLDRLLLTPPEGSGLAILGTFDLPSDFSDLRSKARSQEALDLVAAAPTRTRVFAIGGVPVVAVNLWEQPYGVFAAVGLGTFAQEPRERTFTIDPGRLPDAVGVRLPSQTSTSLAIVFRRGRYMAIVIAPSVGSDENAAVRALTQLARLQADRLPTGATTPYFFPSTLRSVIVTAAVTTVLCGGVLSLGPLAVARRRRRTQGPKRRGDAKTPPPHDVANVTDVSELGAALRHRGLVLAGVDVVAVNLVVVGTLGITGVLRLPAVLTTALILIGLLGGILFTLWWARADRREGHGSAFARELQPSFVGIAAGLIALSLLFLGVALVAYGLANLAFGPSLSLLERSQRLHSDPTLLAVGALVGGAALLVAGGFAVRFARMWVRAGAARLRARDARPPILYLRSFEDDALRLSVAVSGRRPFLELFAVRGSDLFEESIAWQVAPYGPVVAIGRPGRPLKSLGAARELLPDEIWRQGVAERMAVALGVVVIIGATEGLRWEVSELVSGGHLTRTVFVFPPATDDIIRARWHFTVEALGAAAHAVDLAVEPERVLTAVMDSQRTWHTAVADVRDEATYRAALDHSLNVVMGTSEGAVGPEVRSARLSSTRGDSG